MNKWIVACWLLNAQVSGEDLDSHWGRRICFLALLPPYPISSCFPCTVLGSPGDSKLNLMCRTGALEEVREQGPHHSKIVSIVISGVVLQPFLLSKPWYIPHVTCTPKSDVPTADWVRLVMLERFVAPTFPLQIHYHFLFRRNNPTSLI